MKSITITFLLIFVILQTSIGQWEEQSIAVNANFNSVHFFNNEIGFVVGGDKIYKTTDGGENWETSYTTTGAVFFNDVKVLDENTVIVVGKKFITDESIIVKTIDSGTNWVITDISSSAYLHSIFFISPTVGFCAGGNGAIFKTSDSGDSWQSLVSGTSLNLQSIFFINELTGIAVGGGIDQAVILKTVDGGENWSTVASPANDYLQSIYFMNEQTGYVVGWDGQILKTNDCGSTWTEQTSVDMVGNLDVFFTDENTGYVAGGLTFQSLIQKTVDGGDSWQDISPNFSVGFTSIYFPSFDVGYVVGAQGTIAKTESGGIMTSTSNLYSNKDILLYPNPASNSVTIESNKNGPIILIEIYNSNGQLIKVKEENSKNVNLDLSEFQSGIYYIGLNTESQKSIKKLVKR